MNATTLLLATLLHVEEAFLFLNASDKVSMLDLMNLKRQGLPTKAAWKSLYALHVTTHCATFAQLHARYLAALYGESETPIGINPIDSVPPLDFIAWVYYGTCCGADASQPNLFGDDLSKKTIETTPMAWDCDCKHKYMHLPSEETCTLCGAERDSSPDSRKNELFSHGCFSQKSKELFWGALRDKLKIAKSLCVNPQKPTSSIHIPIEYGNCLPFVSSPYLIPIILDPPSAEPTAMVKIVSI